MVLAETVKFDAGEVFLFLLLVLAVTVGLVAAIGAVGVTIGMALGRWGLTADEVQELPRGSRVGLVLGGLAGPIVAWIVLRVLAPGLWGEPPGQWVVLVAPLLLPVAWGWWNGRHRRFGDRPRRDAFGAPPPPPPPDPPSPPFGPPPGSRR